MPDFFRVFFAGVVYSFDGFARGEFSEFWKWKLDPYRIARASAPDLWFRNRDLGEALPSVSERMYEVQEGFFLRQVSALSDGSTLWRSVRKKNGEVFLSYRVSRDRSEVVLLEDHSATRGQTAFEYLCHIVPACMLDSGILTLHGVLMEYEGKGVILCAPSGTGKTTHARLWRDKRNALILNGDRAVCRKADGIWTGYGLPWSGTSGEQINRSVPIKAIAVLERGEKNEAYRVEQLQAFGAVLPHILCPTWDAGQSGKAMDILEELLRKIPVIRFKCRPDPESVEILQTALEGLPQWREKESKFQPGSCSL